MTVTVTSGHVATLRAYLAGDFEEYHRGIERIDNAPDRNGYLSLLSSAFFEAVERKFAATGTNADVIRFVAEARARFDPDGDLIDPSAGERLIRYSLGRGSIDDLDPKTLGGLQLALLTAYVTEAQLDGAKLDEFLDTARELAEP